MTEGTIFLLGPLDFEKQSMYHLSILANVSIFCGMEIEIEIQAFRRGLIIKFFLIVILQVDGYSVTGATLIERHQSTTCQ